MSEEKVSRRGYAKYAAAGVVVIGVAAAGAYYATRPGPAPSPTPTEKPTVTGTESPTMTPSPTAAEQVTIRWLGGGWTMFPEVPDKYLEVTNGRVTVKFTAGGIADLPSKALTTTDWDIYNDIQSYMSPVLAADPRPIQTIDVSNYSTWTNTPPENLWDHMTDPFWFRTGKAGVVPPISQFITDEAMERTVGYFWDGGTAGAASWDGEKWVGGKPMGIPTCSNQEGIGYLPEFVPYEEHGGASKNIDYLEAYKSDYKGHAAHQDDIMLHSGWMGLMFDLHNLGELEGFDGTGGRLTKSDYDKIIDFSIPYVEDGQFRTFAGEFGAMVTTMTTREVWIMQCWQPVVMSTRRGGIPCYWAQTTCGGSLWWSSEQLSRNLQPGNALWDECIKWMNWRMEPWWVGFILRNGYMCPRWSTQDVKDEMGEELWDWQYGGQYTYKDLDGCMSDVWPEDQTYWNAEDRLRNALFIPELYNWTPEKGTPNPNGAIKDHGSSTENFGNLGWIEEFPKEYEYGFEKWTYLKSLLER